MIRAISVTAAILALSAAYAAAEPVRQLGPHQHGHGTLNLAIEGLTVQMELEVPGADIVGFEYEAASADDQAKVKAAEDKLAQPLALFVLPRNAGCKVTSAKVVVARESEEDHDAHEHAHEHDAAHAEAGGHEAEHSEFHAKYALSCSDVAAITTISFPYFDAFPNSEELAVTLITEKSQKVFDVDREHALIDIRGMM
jgi:hypothetical protein